MWPCRGRGGARVKRAHTVAQVRAAEDVLLAQLPGGTLVRRAATGLAYACTRLLGRTYGAQVVLLVGPGNNGADALWAGVRLAARGARVTAVPAGDAVPAALAALRAAGGLVQAEPPDTCDLVVDGLVGIGGHGALRPRAAALARWAAQAGAPVVAVDLPSGLAADTGGAGDGAVCADLTVTFGTFKPGLLVGDGPRLAGRVELVDIGLAALLGPAVVEVLEARDVSTGLPTSRRSDKYSRGVLGVAAGSESYPGAAVLCTGAAVRAGAGMIRFAGTPHPAEQVRARWPEVVVTAAQGAEVVDAGRVQAWVVGPGLGTDRQAEAVVAAVLASDVPVVVDADALTVCARRPDLLRGRSAPTVLTPHDREYERFGRPVGDDRLAAARALAAELGVVVLLKGNATVVAAPDGPLRVNPTGTPSLATAGSGDVLAGGCGALLATGLEPVHAASSAAWLHGRAGSLSAAGGPTSASRLLEAWPDAVREVAAARGAPGAGRPPRAATMG